jgi:5-methylcytosine-specific restriction enzyme A
VRDALVRTRVLERAQGQCELCDAEGFLTADGRKYLETHHVVPLSEQGIDREGTWSVSARAITARLTTGSGVRKFAKR